MEERDAIKSYDPTRFTATFMPSAALQAMLKGDITKFLVVPVEEMYRHVKRAVPAVRNTSHICLFLTEGSAFLRIGTAAYTIHPGDILFVPAGSVFSFHENDVNKGFICIFHDDLLLGKPGQGEAGSDFEFLRVWGNPLVHLDAQTYSFVLHIFQRLWLTYAAQALGHIDIIRAYLIALLHEVNAFYKPLSNEQQDTSVKIIHRFKALIFSNIRRTHLVADYAALLHISPNHLNKTVKTATGKPPGKWIDEAIILEAKVLLSQSDFPISGVAAAVGITDASYFTRLFRKYEGLTPSLFRKKIEQA